MDDVRHEMAVLRSMMEALPGHVHGPFVRAYQRLETAINRVDLEDREKGRERGRWLALAVLVKRAGSPAVITREEAVMLSDMEIVVAQHFATDCLRVHLLPKEAPAALPEKSTRYRK